MRFSAERAFQQAGKRQVGREPLRGEEERSTRAGAATWRVGTVPGAPRANLTDESPFQFLPFMSNQMTRGWRDKLNNAPHPGGAWRDAIPVLVTPVQPCKLHCRAPAECSPAMTVPITTALPSCFKIPHCSQEQSFPQAHSCFWYGAEELFCSSQKHCTMEILSLLSIYMKDLRHMDIKQGQLKAPSHLTGCKYPSSHQPLLL